MKSPLICLLAAIILASCGTPSTSLRVLQPADITIPSHIQKIGLVNRSLPGKNEQADNIIEGVLTGESIGADREGSELSLTGLAETLRQSERFEISFPAAGYTNRTNGGMNINEVRAICNTHKLDALVVLENFDSDSFVEVIPFKKKQKVKEETVELNYFEARAKLNVRTTWRMYDNSTGNVIDFHVSEDFQDFRNEAPNPDEARRGLPSKRHAINRTGRLAGCNYGSRIAPYWISVGRMYFKKGSDLMKKAYSYSSKNNWDKAVEIWKREATNSDPEIAGRANYNMALACERKGNLTLALDYAKRSRDKFDIKEAGRYVTVLENRIRDQNILDRQLAR
jgi:hypothetical protein